uniref:Uncharacterized protein n=1 Tax=Physcomitrium patens TaxID=3218 RepID=A0A2K1IUL4_PHYPA|nr:hypothetical protein PHYPA_024914 [Physcomitrium patens]
MRWNDSPYTNVHHKQTKHRSRYPGRGTFDCIFRAPAEIEAFGCKLLEHVHESEAQTPRPQLHHRQRMALFTDDPMEQCQQQPRTLPEMLILQPNRVLREVKRGCI